jgi:hypothetical protein
MRRLLLGLLAPLLLASRCREAGFNATHLPDGRRAWVTFDCGDEAECRMYIEHWCHGKGRVLERSPDGESLVFDCNGEGR